MTVTWCTKCGCGNDYLGFAHLDHCKEATMTEFSKRQVTVTLIGAQDTMNHIELSDMDAWERFAQDNLEALTEAYGSTANALQHAIAGGLVLGGGAAPMFLITFAE